MTNEEWAGFDQLAALQVTSVRPQSSSVVWMPGPQRQPGPHGASGQQKGEPEWVSGSLEPPRAEHTRSSAMVQRPGQDSSSCKCKFLFFMLKRRKNHMTLMFWGPSSHPSLHFWFWHGSACHVGLDAIFTPAILLLLLLFLLLLLGTGICYLQLLPAMAGVRRWMHFTLYYPS